MNFTLNIHYYFYAIYIDRHSLQTTTTFISSFVHYYYFCVHFHSLFAFISLFLFFSYIFVQFLQTFILCVYCVLFGLLMLFFCILDSHINSLNSHIFFIFMWESLLSQTLYTSTKIPAIYKVIHKFYPIIIFVNQENSETE